MGSNHTFLKTQNMQSILKALLRYGQITRLRLAQLTGLTTATITNLITELINQGVVKEEGILQVNQPKVGRPQMVLQLNPMARMAIGVHIGVGLFRVSLCDLLANPLETIEEPFAVEDSPEEVFDRIQSAIHQIVDSNQVDKTSIIGIGVGASGLVDQHTGENVHAPNLGWRHVQIREMLSAAFPYPVAVDNNVRVMALAEARFGMGKDCYGVSFVYARKGVGAGYFVHGYLYRGVAAGAGEIGHMIIQPDGGQSCRCGNSGCLETLVSEPVILTMAEEIRQNEPDGLLAQLSQTRVFDIDLIFDAARQGDESVLSMLKSRGRYMGIALANLVNMLNPPMIVLGGLLYQGQDILLPTIESTMRSCAFSSLGEQVDLRVTSFGHLTGVIGAAALALTTFFYEKYE